MKLKALFLLATITLFSCEEEYELTIKSETPNLVVSGEITDEGGPFYIRLNQPNDYNAYSLNNFRPKAVEDAQVSIIDNFKNLYSLKEQEYGVYKTTSEFRAIPGRSYSIQIKTKDGVEYESTPELLKQAPQIESLFSQFNKEKSIDRIGWNVNVRFRDRPSTGDFYVWKYKGIYEVYSECPKIDFPPCQYQTTCWKIVESTRVTLLSDKFINGNDVVQKINFVPADYYSPFTLEIAQQNISEKAFRYWQSLQDQSANTGSIFDKLPAQVRGNMICKTDPNQEVLGYFFVKGTSRKYLRINRFNEPEVQKRIGIYNLNFPKQVGDCRRYYLFDQDVIGQYPFGWGDGRGEN